MTSENDAKNARWPPSAEVVMKIGWGLMLFGLTIAAVLALAGAIGVGSSGTATQAGMLLGGVLGVVAGVATLFASMAGQQRSSLLDAVASTKAQLGDVHQSVRSSDSKLDDVGVAVRANGARFQAVNAALGSQAKALDAIDEDLDRVQLMLDAQSGALDEQLDALGKIRKTL